MKAYTDLEQSKKLAEILPLESADMWYCPYPNDVDWYNEPRIGKAELLLNQLPCWSLAALLELIPCADIVKLDTTWTCGSILGRCEADNPVDACVDMIAKLHEQKLL